MKGQELVNYHRVAEAIEFIRENFKQQPKLEELASRVNLSSFHFQRLFSEWAGTTPKKFLQYMSLEHAKKLLKEQQATLFDTAFETGLSGTGRLHDLFISIEGMTPAEYKKGGENISIYYSFSESPFGNLIMASSTIGICHIAFHDDKKQALADLKLQFPNASYTNKMDVMHKNVLQFFQQDWSHIPEIKLHLKATDFQLKVWESLLKIPMGKLTSYGSIAHQIGKPKSSRAVGTAIGSNPIAFLIPCHRVIQSTGNFGGYMWGKTRKTAIIAWESAKMNCE